MCFLFFIPRHIPYCRSHGHLHGFYPPFHQECRLCSIHMVLKCEPVNCHDLLIAFSNPSDWPREFNSCQNLTYMTRIQGLMLHIIQRTHSSLRLTRLLFLRKAHRSKLHPLFPLDSLLLYAPLYPIDEGLNRFLTCKSVRARDFGVIFLLDNLQRQLGNFSLLVLDPGLDLGSISFCF